MAADAETPELVVGRYLLYGALASGGMATVHLGRMIGPAGFSRTVAIKRLHAQYAHDPHFAASLLDEARLSARIGHPNVVQTLDVVATDEHLLVVMEYVQGESLSRLMKATLARGERVPVRIAVAIMAGALHGLHAAHQATNEKGDALHIVHRDVSPQNIMVGVDGASRVLDFGVAMAVGRLQDTQTGQLKGKLSYMAPEQISAQPIDRRTDVFAASIVLWEVLTSKRLFAGDSEASTVGNLLMRPIEPPSAHARDLPSGLDEIVVRGLSRDPAGRFQTAHDMALALEEVVPPATATQTGAWVNSLAQDAIVGRAKRVRHIESSTSGVDVLASAKGGAVARSLDEIREMPTSVVRVSVADAVVRRLASYLGPHTARVAVKTFSMRAVGRGPETLTPADVPQLVAALRPMLRTFIGRAQCEQVLSAIAAEVGS